MHDMPNRRTLGVFYKMGIFLQKGNDSNYAKNYTETLEGRNFYTTWDYEICSKAIKAEEGVCHGNTIRWKATSSLPWN
jgi:hypothetical protein